MKGFIFKWAGPIPFASSYLINLANSVYLGEVYKGDRTWLFLVVWVSLTE
jgi:hypothetical protein